MMYGTSNVKRYYLAVCNAKPPDYGPYCVLIYFPKHEGRGNMF